MPAPTEFREAADYPTTTTRRTSGRTALAWTKGKTTLFDKVLAIQDALAVVDLHDDGRLPAAARDRRHGLPRGAGGVLPAVRDRDGAAAAVDQHPGPRGDRLHRRRPQRPRRPDAVPRQYDRHPQLGRGAVRPGTDGCTFEPTPGTRFVESSTSGYTGDAGTVTAAHARRQPMHRRDGGPTARRRRRGRPACRRAGRASTRRPGSADPVRRHRGRRADHAVPRRVRVAACCFALLASLVPVSHWWSAARACCGPATSRDG